MLQNDKMLIINAFVIPSDSEESIINQHFVKTYRTNERGYRRLT
jgi:hypothetical protein